MLGPTNQEALDRCLEMVVVEDWPAEACHPETAGARMVAGSNLLGPVWVALCSYHWLAMALVILPVW